MLLTLLYERHVAGTLTVLKSVPGCEYGDRAFICDLSYCEIETNWYACCETCMDYEPPTLQPSTVYITTTTLASTISTEVPDITTPVITSSTTASTTTASQTTTQDYTTTEEHLTTEEEVTTSPTTTTSTTTTTTTTMEDLTTSQSHTTTEDTTTTPITTTSASTTTEPITTEELTTTSIITTPSTPTTTLDNSTTSSSTITSSSTTSTTTSSITTTPAPECVDIGVDGIPCKAFVANYTFLCYEYEDKCCATCARLENTYAPDCPYGDHDLSVCWDLQQDLEGDAIIDNRAKCYMYGDTCCATCGPLAGPDEACMYGDLIVSYCASITPSECYFMELLCCETCPLYYNENSEPGCEYGDKEDHKQCEEYAAEGCVKDWMHDDCCETCAIYR